MNGMVTWETLYWVIGIVSAAGSAVAVFLFWVWRIVEGVRKERAAEIDALHLKIEAESARAKLAEADFDKQLGNYRQHVGEVFATKEGVTTAVGRVEQSVQRVEIALDRMTDRIDRVLVMREAG